ncbi:MAG: hypothetical protein IT371_13105 [Deltaproteobacteria bacterium]|nr:hypothetical protein [Deltaproteobacteria bacterium]
MGLMVGDDSPGARKLPLALILAGASVLVIVGGTFAAYQTSDRLPPPRALPPPPEESATSSDRYTEAFYRGAIEDDARKLKLAKPSLGLMRGGLPYRIELSEERKLSVGNAFETGSLKLQLVSKKLWVGDEGQGYRAEHLVLALTNKLGRPIAYRVVTRVPEKCGAKGMVAQNAIALQAGERMERTECLLRRSTKLSVHKVEVLELTPLGYHYVTRLDPSALSYDERTAEGHRQGPLGGCRAVPWRPIRSALTSQEARWYDVLDFYARHNCDEYSFRVGYRWSAAGPPRLPVRPTTKE